MDELTKARRAPTRDLAMEMGVSHLESMLRDGWVRGEWVEGGPKLTYDLPSLASTIHFNHDMAGR